ncbi:MAG: hypothetical protein ACI4DO_04395 [Roseburia sp.]
MKRKAKRFFSLFLIFAMILGMLPAMPIKAAVSETITSLTLTGVKKPVPGETVTTEGIFLGDMVEIDPSWTFWSVWDDETEEYIRCEDTDIFESGKRYALAINAAVKDGYVFALDMTVFYNGKDIPNLNDTPQDSYNTAKIVLNCNLSILILAEDIPNPQYDITITNGKAAVDSQAVATAEEGAVVTITADAPAEGKAFDKWEVVSGSVTFANATSATTTFVMPKGAVSVKAVYKDLNGWVTTENGQKVYYQNGSIVKNQWFQDGEKQYYINETGALATDWQKIGGIWYYFYIDGTMAVSTWIGGSYVGASGAWVENPLPEGWMQSGSRWWYQYPDGTYAQSTWKKIGGEWYYFDAAGWMATGWTYDGSDWYYMNASGTMKTGWLNDGGIWYYLKPSGAMATGWVSDGGNWYLMDESGAMKTGWAKQGDDWYYLDASGAMQTGWLKDGNTWYYLMSSGAMAHDTVIDGYTLNADGAWVQ